MMGGQVRAIRRRKDYRQINLTPAPPGESVHRGIGESLGLLNEVRDAASILVNLVQMSLQLLCHPLTVSVREIAILNEDFLGSKST